jgi:hypothetical protein
VIVVAWSTVAAHAPAGVVSWRNQIDRFAIRRPRDDTTQGGSGCAFTAVMARPLAVLIPTLALLTLLGTPFNVNIVARRDDPAADLRRQAFDIR